MAASNTPLLTKGITAPVALAQFSPVKLDGSLALAGEAIVGFSTHAVSAGERLAATVHGSAIAIAGAAIAFGDVLQVGTAGTMIPRVSGRIAGRALNAAAIGDQVEVLIEAETAENASFAINPLTGGISGLTGPDGKPALFVYTKSFEPSGDVTGATDYAAIAPWALAGYDIVLGKGTFYFNNTLVRGFRRNTDGTLQTSNWKADSVIGNFNGSGSSRTKLIFTDSSKPCMELWTRPELVYRTATQWLNPINGNATLYTNRAVSWSGGNSTGFAIEGACAATISAVPTVSATGWVDTSPNHIGFLVWGACADHVSEDVIITRCGIGRVLHDTTGFIFNRCKNTGCGIGEAHAVQWDGNSYNWCTQDDCRVGSTFSWRGIYEASAYTRFGRESAGTYIPTPVFTQGQSNSYNGCRWYACKQSALAGHDDPADLSADGNMWSNEFISCYFENNALTLIAPQNNGGGSWVFKSTFFETFNTALAESLRLTTWFKDRMSISQTSLNGKFCPFTHWFGGGSSDDSILKFVDCSISISDYGHVIADAWHVEIDRCKFPLGIGNTSSAIVTALGAARGFARTQAGFWWSPRTPINASQGNDNWKLWVGFVSRNGGPYMSTTTGMALPTAAVLWNGTIAGLLGGAGVADLLYVCQKSTADTYSWKLLSTG